jgi:AAA family ATP:ADP antiporter
VILIAAPPRRSDRALSSAGAFFCILCAYYLLRPLRDELGVRGGVEHLDTLFSMTLCVMMAAMAGYVWLSARVERRWIVSASYFFVSVSLLAFRGGLGLVGDATYARALFVWISVINLFLVSGFWSVMSDSFDRDTGLRRFGPIAAGGTAGALLGPLAAAGLAPHVQAADLLVPAASLIAIAAILLHQVAHGASGERKRALATAPWQGLERIVLDPRLRGLAAMVALHAVLSTFIYLLQARLVAAGLAEPAQRLRLFASSDLAVNLLTLLFQVALLGSGVLSVWPALAPVVAVNVLMRVVQFAFTRPARELLFTSLPPVDRYRSRAALDTLVYRASDAFGAWLVGALGAIGLGTAGIAAAGIPLAALWLELSRRTVGLIGTDRVTEVVRGGGIGNELV